MDASFNYAMSRNICLVKSSLKILALQTLVVHAGSLLSSNVNTIGFSSTVCIFGRNFPLTKVQKAIYVLNKPTLYLKLSFFACDE